MTTVYDDSRLTYDHPNATYNGLWLLAAAGSQPTPTGSGALTRRLLARRAALAGAQGASTGALTARLRTHHVTVSSTQPPASSSLVGRIAAQLRSITGQVGVGTGTLSYHITYVHELQGGSTQPPSEGLLTRAHHQFRWSAGIPSPATGTLNQRVEYHATPFWSTQPPATGTLRTGYLYRRTITGQQPIQAPVIYEQPLATYDQPGLFYEVSDPGYLIRRWRTFAHLAGSQPPATGSFAWIWGVYTWAQYQTYVRDTPGTVAYVTPVETDDADVRYDATVRVEQADGGIEIVYRVRAPRATVHERG